MFPDHWSFLLGELALYSFVVLVATGVYLTFFFHPGTEIVRYDGSYEPLRGVEMTEAYRSAVELSFDVRAGLVMRQIHHWAALLFIAAIVVHLMRIFFTGAFRRPRELNWMIGVTLLILAIFNGFAGYSLLDDQLSGTGLRIAYSITLSIPLAGTWLASFLFGGEFPGPDIINRLYVIHILLLPAIIAALIGAHLVLVVRHKHTQFAGQGPDRGQRGRRGGVAELRLQVDRAHAAGRRAAGRPRRAGPDQPDLALRPVRPGRGELRLAARLVHGLARRRAPPLPAVGDPRLRLRAPRARSSRRCCSPASPSGSSTRGRALEALFTGDRRPHHLLDRPRDRPVRTSLGVATLSFYTVLTLAASNDVIATTFGLSVNAVVVAFRVLSVVLPPIAGRRHLPALQRPPGPRHRQRRSSRPSGPASAPSCSASGSGEGASAPQPATD